ncbi:MAG: hypothetical protein J6328_01170 [Bacilli bacterium]|nr:hypothetical protein [Bacilli bacterium]
MNNALANDKIGVNPSLLKADRHNALTATTTDDVAVSTSDVDGDLILSFAISESLESELLAAGVETVSVFYGYVPYEQESVSNDIVLERGTEVAYELSRGRVIRLIIKDRGTADYADKKYQGVLAYTLNEVQYVSDTKSISQTYETITDDVTDNLVARYNFEKTVEETGDNKYQDKKTYKLTGKADKYTGVRVTTTQLKGNLAGAKLSFTCKTENAKSSGLFFKLTDEVGANLSGAANVKDATCAPEIESVGVSKNDLNDGWYRFTIDFSTAFAAMQSVQMLPAMHPEFVFTSAAKDVVPVIYIADIQLSYPRRAALAQPAITLQNKTITWSKVKNAKSYSVYVDGALMSTYTNSDDLSYTDTHTEPGSHEIKVVANPSDKGYFYESSASAISKIVDESLEADDISNKISKNYGVEISDNYDAFYAGSHSKEIAISSSGAINIQASDLGGIKGKQLTFYVQMTNADYLSTSYIHLTFQYYNTANAKVGNAATNYVNFGSTSAHADKLGTSERIEGSNWVRCAVRLDDPLFGDLGEYKQIKYVRVAIPDRCTFNIDAMTVSDTPTD